MPCAMVADDTTSITVHQFDESTINTVSAEHAAQFAGFGYGRQSSFTARAINFATLCDEVGVRHPDVLCLDVEGMDLAILRAIDFERNRPKLICVEVVQYLEDRTPVVDRAFAEFLLSKGYSKYADTFINQIFVDESVQARQRLI